MAALFQVGTHGAAHDLEDVHLPAWRVLGTDADVARWFEWHLDTPESLAKQRNMRTATWHDAVQNILPQRREIVILSPKGVLIAGAVLAGYPCPVDSEVPGVEFSYAVHSAHRGAGVATAFLEALPRWVEADAGTRHTFGGVCSTNSASLSVLAASAFDHVDTSSPCIGSDDQRRHHCSDVELKYCWGHH